MAKEQENLSLEEIAIKKGQEYLAEIEARIESEIAAGFLNPFGEGVNYKHFLGAIPAGVSVKEYLKGKLVSLEIDAKKEAELIEGLESDLAFYAPYKTFLTKLEGSKAKK
jgi:hypothetical protein